MKKVLYRAILADVQSLIERATFPLRWRLYPSVTIFGLLGCLVLISRDMELFTNLCNQAVTTNIDTGVVVMVIKISQS